MEDDFYIGYEPEMSSSMASRIAAAAGGLLTLAIVLGGALVLAQARFSNGSFDYGHPRQFEGRVFEYPYPAIEVATGGHDATWYWLVGPGKHGAAALVKGLDGRHVRLTGTLIEREASRMIEVVPSSVTPSPAPVQAPSARAIGPATFQGEIVDSKCHLGVMKPGEGPTHRDCAVRCLLGQVPPMLFVHEGHGPRRLTLVATDGGAFRDAVSSIAGRPVRVRGTLFERGGEQFLVTSIAQIEVAG